jgi:hypothetical protein
MPTRRVPVGERLPLGANATTPDAVRPCSLDRGHVRWAQRRCCDSLTGYRWATGRGLGKLGPCPPSRVRRGRPGMTRTPARYRFRRHTWLGRGRRAAEGPRCDRATRPDHLRSGCSGPGDSPHWSAPRSCAHDAPPVATAGRRSDGRLRYVPGAAAASAPHPGRDLRQHERARTQGLRSRFSQRARHGLPEGRLGALDGGLA